jgi:hypothetical protein
MPYSKVQIATVFGFLVLIVLIPIISFVIKSRIDAQQTLANKNYNQPVTDNNAQPVPNSLPSSNKLALNDNNPTNDASQSAQVSYGPTLSFAVSLQGRPTGNEGGKFFVGVAQGDPTNNPQYILSFTVDVPASGTYTGLSLVGLNQGMNYTAYIKGPAQIVKAVPFALTPTGANLNAGAAVSLTTGDVNEDNVIDSADIAVIKTALGASTTSQKWNPNLDFNADGVINNFDLAIALNNLGKVGDSGAWYSRIDPSASSSAQLNIPRNIGGPTGKPGGYWLWMPAP